MRPFWIPAGIGAGILLVSSICRGECGGGAEGVVLTLLSGTTIAVTYMFYKLGGRADRGAVLVVLDESTANKPPVPSQPARPSSD